MGRKRKEEENGYSSFLSGYSVLGKSPLLVGRSAVQHSFSYEEGVAFHHRISSKASLAQGEIGISWILYIVQLASF